MRSVEEHRRVVAELIAPRPPVGIPLADALGLVLAEDVVAPLSLPGFDNSAMDGYAVVAEDIAGASDRTARAAARRRGHSRGPHRSADAETRYRTPDHDGRAAAVRRHRRGARRSHRRRDGHRGDPRDRAKPGSTSAARARTSTAGTTVLRAGQVVTPAVLGLAAALGLGELTVVPRQRVLVMSTGSELVAAGHAAAAGSDLRVQRGHARRGRRAMRAPRWSRRR